MQAVSSNVIFLNVRSTSTNANLCLFGGFCATLDGTTPVLSTRRLAHEQYIESSLGFDIF